MIVRVIQYPFFSFFNIPYPHNPVFPVFLEFPFQALLLGKFQNHTTLCRMMEILPSRASFVAEIIYDNKYKTQFSLLL